ncbi:MAG TPA: YggS family pyridoxal phosphate-dependent enzyme [Acidimicrobiales bacterium]|nr:YggS family pyridoxal phosphate-dependent enzyme [Acidimicrobiales bacterium]
MTPSTDGLDAATLRARVAAVEERIAAAGGDPARVRLLAVTKTVAPEVVAVAAEVGLRDLGESYAQELAAKAEVLPRELRWHFIGRLQRNKVRLVAPFVHLWQSVDRLSLAAEIAHRAPGAAVLVQVNVTGAEQQGGCPPERVAAVVDGCRDLGLEVRGLMAIGAQGDHGAVRAGFRQVRALADRLELAERSMGMSGDLEAAVAEGSTMVRVGTALFGPRARSQGVGK